MPSAVQRRRIVALAAASGSALLIGIAAGAGSGEDSSNTATGEDAPARGRPQLPGGGRRLFPDRRVVAFYGSPRDDELGALGVGRAAQMLRKLRRQAEPYARRTRPVLPALELIATLATAAPGADGLHRDSLPDAAIRRYLRLARAAKGLLILDIQPGRARFPAEIVRLDRWLREPDVGLALDSEWHVRADQVPGQVIGSVDADLVNATARHLADIVRRHDLPEKLLIVHRFTEDMIARDERLAAVPGVRTVINVDGFGGRAAKLSKYEQLIARTPRLHRGFKLFYREDVNLLAPQTVLELRPPPDVVVYE